jgi:ribosome modulation factor
VKGEKTKWKGGEASREREEIGHGWNDGMTGRIHGYTLGMARRKWIGQWRKGRDERKGAIDKTEIAGYEYFLCSRP